MRLVDTFTVLEALVGFRKVEIPLEVVFGHFATFTLVTLSPTVALKVVNWGKTLILLREVPLKMGF